MDFLLDVDLDWLCLGAELAAGLLILSLAWRPSSRTAKSSAALVASAVDWEPLQNAHAHAVTGTGRSLALRSNPTDEQRQRDLLRCLPSPFRDRLTGTFNANGMDRLIREWSCEPDMACYPSCFAMLSLSKVEQLMEQHGAACIEQAIKQISELLIEQLGGNASISRYQPHSFLLHHFGRPLSECRDSFAMICEQIAAPEFFMFNEEAVQLTSDLSYWFCNRSVEPEELLQLLSEYGDEGVPEQGCSVQEQITPAEPEQTPEPEKPFSIDALAPFPCPWDSQEEPAGSEITESTSAVEEASTPAEASGQQVPQEIPTEDSDTLEGFASTDQIDELLAQLNTGIVPEPILEEADQQDPDPPVQNEFDESTSIFGPEDEDSEEDSRDVSASKNSEDFETGELTPAPKLDMPEPAAELPSSRSIYTDDIEESLLKDDLASLFAAVRSSAVGDFGYDGIQASKMGPNHPNPPQKGPSNGTSSP